MKRKITVIGGGSLLFTPGIIKNCLLLKSLSDSELVLFNPTAEKAELMLHLGLLMNESIKSGLEIRIEKDRKKALEGASFVILTINPGGFKSHLEDIMVPFMHGIKQSVGDTVGPGGIFRTLRFVPKVIEICADMEKVCPKAYLINYSNPMTSIVQAAYRHSKIKAVGLCHDFAQTAFEIEKLLKEDEIHFDFAGLNHCVWILGMKKKNKDLYPALRKLAEEGKYPEEMKARFDLLKLFGVMPAGGEKHVIEFFPFYLKKEVNTEKEWNIPLRQNALKGMMKERERLHRSLVKQAKGQEEIPGLKEKSPEKETEFIESIIENKALRMNLNVLNTAGPENMPPDCVLELPAVVNKWGFWVENTVNMPDSVFGNTLAHSIKIKLAVDAAAGKDRKKAIMALISDPLVPSVREAEEMLDEIITLQPEYLGYLK